MDQYRAIPRLPSRRARRPRLLSPRRAGPAAPAVPAAEVPIPLSAVWPHLSGQQQALLRQTLLQTLQEVISHVDSC
jgi:hypothetical protein